MSEENKLNDGAKEKTAENDEAVQAAGLTDVEGPEGEAAPAGDLFSGYSADEQRKIIGLVIIFIALFVHLIGQFSESAEERNRSIIPAARAGNLKDVKDLVQGGLDVDFKGGGSETALNAACLSKSTETVKYLLKKGADVNTYNSNGVSPIHRVCVNKRLEMLKALIAAKADVNNTDFKKLTPLHYAALKDFKEAVPLLLAAGADPNKKDKQGVTPLHVALGERNIDIGVDLVLAGADLEAKSNRDVKPLQFLSGFERIEFLAKIRSAKSKQKQESK